MNTYLKTGIQKKTLLNLTPVIDLIAEKSGIHIKQNQFPKLDFTIREQMLKRNMSSVDTYYKEVVLQQEEFYHLVGRLTVNETYFLREPAYMKLFSRRLVPELLSGKQRNETIKIVSAGCSTGPEPYSLVIMLMEAYGSNCGNLFSIIGFDIDQYALLQAQEGVYGKHSFRNFNPELKEKYFQSLGNARYKIRDKVQKMVEFLHLNLMNNDYPPCLKEADIIFYRNVSIYFAPPKQQLIFKKLLALLNPGGYIITSATEVHHHDFNIISSKEIDGVFIFCKSGEESLAGIPIKAIKKKGEKGVKFLLPGNAVKYKPIEPRIETRQGEISYKTAFLQLMEKTNGMKGAKPEGGKSEKSIPDTKSLFREASCHVQTKNYGKALQLLDSVIGAAPGFVKAWTLKAAVLMNQNDLAGAKLFCMKAIEKGPLQFEGYLLAGLIARLENDPPQAIKRFKESLYLDPSCWLSHFYLAEVYKSKGDSNQAVLGYQSVIRHIEAGAKIQGAAFPYISFTARQVRHLCDHNIAQLKRSSAPGG